MHRLDSGGDRPKKDLVQEFEVVAELEVIGQRRATEDRPEVEQVIEQLIQPPTDFWVIASPHVVDPA